MDDPRVNTPAQEWSLGPGMPRRSKQYGISIDAILSVGKKYAPLVLAAGVGILIGYAASLSSSSTSKEYPLSIPYKTLK